MLYVRNNAVAFHLFYPANSTDTRSKKHRPSGFWRLASNDRDQTSLLWPPIHAKNAFHGPKVPVVKPTLPNANGSNKPNPNRPSALDRPTGAAPKSQEPTIGPRRFHLTKSSLKVSSPYAASETPAQRRARSRRNEIAVFVEAGKTLKVKPKFDRQGSNEEVISRVNDEMEKEAKRSAAPRKRPNATAAELQWRAENWTKPTEQKHSTVTNGNTACDAEQPSHTWNYKSPELAIQLQKIAFQETGTPEEHVQSHPNCQPLKVRPKPPKPRRPALNNKANEDHVDKDEVMVEAFSEDKNEYVFDTYVRSIAQPVDNVGTDGALIDPLHGVEPVNMGLLIIEDGEEEDLWETFGEENDNDSELNSEEEDENGWST